MLLVTAFPHTKKKKKQPCFRSTASIRSAFCNSWCFGWGFTDHTGAGSFAALAMGSVLQGSGIRLTSCVHVQKTGWFTLFLAWWSHGCSRFEDTTGTVSLVSACLLQAVWPANELGQRTTPVCPCSRGQWTRSSLLDIAPAKADRTAGGACPQFI